MGGGVQVVLDVRIGDGGGPAVEAGLKFTRIMFLNPS